MSTQNLGGYQLIIEEEVNLVNHKAKNTKKLHELLYELQLSPTIPQNLLTPQNILLSLEVSLAEGDLNQFYNCFNRNSHALKALGSEKVAEIAKFYEEDQCEKLVVSVREFVKDNQNLRLKGDQILVGVYKYILAQYAANFHNYQIRKLEKSYGISGKWLIDHHYNINDGFVILEETPQDQNLQQILQKRIQEVVELTKNVIELGK